MMLRSTSWALAIVLATALPPGGAKPSAPPASAASAISTPVAVSQDRAAINWDDVRGWTGVIALGISTAGFWLSLANFRRDRPKLVASSKFSPGWEGFDPTVEVSAVNAGRRPMILRGIGRQGARDQWAMTYLDLDSGGVRLGEHERRDFSLGMHDLLEVTPDEDFEVVDLWFEDTLGNRYPVQDAKANLNALRARRPPPRSEAPQATSKLPQIILNGVPLADHSRTRNPDD